MRMKTIRRRLLTALAWLLLIFAIVFFYSIAKRYARIKRVKESVVHVVMRDDKGNFVSIENGFVINEKGYVVLNTPNLLKSSMVEIETVDGDTYTVKNIVSENENYAIVIVSAGIHGVLPPKISKTAVRKGDKITVIGYREKGPDYLYLKKHVEIGNFVFGIQRKSEKKRRDLSIGEVRSTPIGKFYQIADFNKNKNIYWRFEGSPVVNAKGEVVGIVSVEYYIIPIEALAQAKYRGMDMRTFKENKKPTPKSLYQEGLKNLALGAPFTAADYFKKAIELDPSFADVYFQLAKVKKDEAIKAYKKFIELKPGKAGAYYGLGKELYYKSRKDEARKYLKKAVELKPDYPDAWIMLANTYEKEEKLKVLKKALEKNPDNLKILQEIARYYDWWGENEKAVQIYKKLLKKKPNDIQILSDLSLALRHNTTAALEIDKTILKLNPKNEATLFNIAGDYANLAAKTGKKKYYYKAIKYYKKAIKADTFGDAYARRELALIYAKLGKEKEAFQQIFMALAEDKNSYLSHFFLGLICQELGEDEKAINAYKQALRLKPDYAPAHFNLANLYLHANNKEAALPHYEFLKKKGRYINPELKKAFE